MTSSFNAFSGLLGLFKNLNENTPKVRPTLMSVSGYPHYENVISNILAFLLDSSAEHGQNDLWVKSLMDCYIMKSPEEDLRSDAISVHSVDREQLTTEGNRIDIVITGEPYTIGIENKIFSSVYNDLDEYSAEIEKLANFNVQSQPINILLSVKNEESSLRAGFINITCSELLDKVKSNMEEYREEADDIWLINTDEFIYTMEQYVMTQQLDLDFIRFLEDDDHYNVSVEFLNKINDYRRSIKRTLDAVTNLLQNSKIAEKFPDYNLKIFTWQTSGLALYACNCVGILEKDSDKYLLTIETFNSACGWKITLFDRDMQHSEELRKKKINFEDTLKRCGFAYEWTENNRYAIKTLSYETGVEDLSKSIVDEASKALKFLQEYQDS